MNNRKCACCNLYELPHGSVFEICPVCGWEDDDLQNEQPDFEGGANELSLNQARQLFKEKQQKESAIDKNICIKCGRYED